MDAVFYLEHLFKSLKIKLNEMLFEINLLPIYWKSSETK